jgi:Flp pilus assembly protein TadG
MSASMKTSLRDLCQRLIPAKLVRLRRFAKRQDGAVAVEFALVMLPFLLLMFIIMETALVFFAGQTLETAVADSARLIKTGQAQNSSLTQATFKTAVCARVYALFDCSSGMYVDVQTYSDFSSISTTVTYDSSGNPVTTYSPGSSGDIVVVRLIYKWPIAIPMVQTWLANSGSSRLLVATAAFRNEPF